MRNEVSIEIDRPIDEVFQLTNDHVAEWSIIVVEDEIIDKHPKELERPFARSPKTMVNGWSFKGSSRGTIRLMPTPFD